MIEQDDFSAKYEDEWRWWETYLNGPILDWYKHNKPINYYQDLPPRKPPGEGGITEAAMAFRQETANFYITLSWSMDPDRNYGNILDVGCGPLVPSAILKGTAFGIDPNIPDYRRMGYPVDQYGAILLPFAAEDMWMLPDDFFDTILSNNALNHVNDFEQTVAEMQRVAKPDAFWRFETEYREPTLAEPHLLDDERVLAAFAKYPPVKLRERHWDGIIASVLWGTPDENLTGLSQ